MVFLRYQLFASLLLGLLVPNFCVRSTSENQLNLMITGYQVLSEADSSHPQPEVLNDQNSDRIHDMKETMVREENSDAQPDNYRTDTESKKIFENLTRYLPEGQISREEADSLYPLPEGLYGQNSTETNVMQDNMLRVESDYAKNLSNDVMAQDDALYNNVSSNENSTNSNVHLLQRIMVYRTNDQPSDVFKNVMRYLFEKQTSDIDSSHVQSDVLNQQNSTRINVMQENNLEEKIHPADEISNEVVTPDETPDYNDTNNQSLADADEQPLKRLFIFRTDTGPTKMFQNVLRYLTEGQTSRKYGDSSYTANGFLENHKKEPLHVLLFGFIFIGVGVIIFMGVIIISFQCCKSFKTTRRGYTPNANKNSKIDEKDSMKKLLNDAEMNGVHNSAYKHYAKC